MGTEKTKNTIHIGENTKQIKYNLVIFIQLMGFYLTRMKSESMRTAQSTLGGWE